MDSVRNKEDDDDDTLILKKLLMAKRRTLPIRNHKLVACRINKADKNLLSGTKKFLNLNIFKVHIFYSLS